MSFLLVLSHDFMVLLLLTVIFSSASLFSDTKTWITGWTPIGEWLVQSLRHMLH